MDAEQLAVIYLAKAAAELSAADAALPGSERIACRGASIADVVLVCGQPDEGDRRNREAMSGRVGEAAALALAALHVDPGSVLAVCSRPVAGADEARAQRLRLVIEAADPGTVIALDPEAAADLAAACGVGSLEPGGPVHWQGRVIGSVGDLGASLKDASLKAGVWAAFREMAPTDSRS